MRNHNSDPLGVRTNDQNTEFVFLIYDKQKIVKQTNVSNIFQVFLLIDGSIYQRHHGV